MPKIDRKRCLSRLELMLVHEILQKNAHHAKPKYLIACQNHEFSSKLQSLHLNVTESTTLYKISNKRREKTPPVIQEGKHTFIL